MSGAEEPPVSSPVTREHLIARYEELRRQVLGDPGRGSGLILFLRQGMKAWMDAGGQPVAGSPAATHLRLGPDRLYLPEPRAEVVFVLAAMALSGREVNSRL